MNLMDENTESENNIRSLQKVHSLASTYKQIVTPSNGYF